MEEDKDGLRPSGTWLSRAIFVFRMAISVGILVYLIRIFDWERVEALLSEVRLEFLWLGPVLLVLGTAIAGVRWSVLLRDFGIGLPKSTGFAYYLIGGFYSILLPGVISGDAIRAGLCASAAGKSVATIGLSVFIERILGILLLVVLGALGSLALPAELAEQLGPTVTRALPPLAVVIVLAAIASYFMVQRSRPRIPASTEGVGRLVGLAMRVLNKLRHVRPSTLAGVALLTACYQGADIVASFYIAKSIHIDAPLTVFFVTIPVVYVMSIVPISLGGLGVREGVLAFLLSRIGVPVSDAVLLGLLLYANRVLVALPGGLLQLLRFSSAVETFDPVHAGSERIDAEASSASAESSDTP